MKSNVPSAPSPETAFSNLINSLHAVAAGLSHPDAKRVAASLAKMRSEGSTDFALLWQTGRKLALIIQNRIQELENSWIGLAHAADRVRCEHRSRLAQIESATFAYRQQIRSSKILLPLELRERLSESRNSNLVVWHARTLRQVKAINRLANEKEFAENQEQAVVFAGQEATKLLVQQATSYHCALVSAFSQIEPKALDLPESLTETMKVLAPEYWRTVVKTLVPPNHHATGWFALSRSVMIGAVTGGWTGQHLMLSLPLISEPVAWVGSLIGAWIGYKIYRKDVEEAVLRDAREACAELVRRITARATLLMACAGDRWDSYTLELERRLKHTAMAQFAKDMRAIQSNTASVKAEMATLRQGAMELSRLSVRMNSLTSGQHPQFKTLPSPGLIGNVPAASPIQGD